MKMLQKKLVCRIIKDTYLSPYRSQFRFSSLNASGLIVDNHKEVKIYFSDSNNIYFNLALEQFLFEKDLSVPKMMLWKNNDSVIIGFHFIQFAGHMNHFNFKSTGKYQNQWQECNMVNLYQDSVPFVRRKTGGGTVYHDMGNICFSFMTPIFRKDIYPLDPRQYNVRILQSAMSNLGISTGLTARKDLTINEKKISGSAYQATIGNKFGEDKRCLHHGTLLVNANLDRLWRYLKPKEKQIKSKAQNSVVSTVCNISDIYPQISETNIFTSLCDAFANFYGVGDNVSVETLHEKEMMSNQYVKKEMDLFQSWDWVSSKTPKFENILTIPLSLGSLTIRIEQAEGYVDKIEFTFEDTLLYYTQIALNDAFAANRVIYDIKDICLAISNAIENNHLISEFEKDIIRIELIPILTHLI